MCKVEVVTLNYKNSRAVNFESIRKLVVEKTQLIQLIHRTILRTPVPDIITRREKKICRDFNLKRGQIERFYSLPYGFKKHIYKLYTMLRYAFSYVIIPNSIFNCNFAVNIHVCSFRYKFYGQYL